MKVVIKKNNNLFINNYKIFRLNLNIKTNNRQTFMHKKLLVGRHKNHLLLFKSCYHNNFSLNNLIINQISFYILLNSNSNYYSIIKGTHFEYVYNLTYKIILNIMVKRRVKIIFANKFIVYINFFICLTKNFINKT
jgi:hypothetical protein